MKALITGGCGFIGSHLAEALLARGDEVTVVDDLSTGRFENIEGLVGRPGFRFAIETIQNEAVMDRLISECDIIYHLAAAVGVELIVKEPVRVIETNIKGCEAILRIGARYRKKVMLASTSEVYGKSEAVPFREDADRVLGSTTRSRWSYACSKAMDEFLALAYAKQLSLPVVIMRFFNTVGPRQTGRYGMVVPRFVQQALRNEPLTVYGDGQQSRCFTYVDDVVRAIIGLADEPKAVGQVYNIGGTQEVTIEELAARTIALSGSASPIVHIPYSQAYEEGFEDMRRRVPDITKIKEAIGWEPQVDLDGILTRVIASFRAQTVAS
ncbi:MAG: NAD-dependent epimerase/dehydratase family protein, partial [Chloroflexi bacterium]|nr:NAD-dependent epimerase/dehydratase family protein [Chloroflexota bacterium]